MKFEYGQYESEIEIFSPGHAFVRAYFFLPSRGNDSDDATSGWLAGWLAGARASICVRPLRSDDG